MEARLFAIGVAMGLFAWGSRKVQKSGGWRGPLGSALWHALFWAISGFSIAVIFLLSMAGRFQTGFVPSEGISPAELYPSAVFAGVCALVSFARGCWKSRQAVGREYFLSEDSEWAETVFSAVLLAAFLMYFVVQAFKIPSSSMERTFLIGDHLFANKFIYGLRIPMTDRRIFTWHKVQKGDVVVFQFPDREPQHVHCGSTQAGKDFIKRVIGLPGDLIAVSAGRLIVNGKPAPEEPYAQYVDGPRRQPESVEATRLSPKRYQELWQNHELDGKLQDVQRDYFGPVTVPPGKYFMMGDNRDRSCDSRYWGPVDFSDVEGKAWFLYWPPWRMKLVSATR